MIDAVILTHAIWAFLAVIVATPIAISAYRNPDRKVFGVPQGDVEQTDELF